MQMRSFRFKLMAVLAILVAVVVTPMALSWVGLQRSIHYAERSHAAHEVLDAHLLLAKRGERLLRHVQTSGSGGGDPVETARLRRTLDARFALARRTIAAEATMAGPAGRAVETRELERLEEIRRGLELALAGNNDTRWRELIVLTVADERATAEAADAASRRINDTVQLGFAIASVLGLLVGAVALLILQRSLQRPLSRLTAGTQALAAGKLSHRIDMAGKDEFAALGRDFDRMAENIERQASTIADARDLLEGTVRERTSELAAANARLEDVAERRQRFLADISHELRTPLTIIRGEAEVTLRGAALTAEDCRATLVRIVEQAQTMARLVNDLLFVARTESGEPRLIVGRVDLSDMLARAADDWRALVADDGGDIRFAAGAGAETAAIEGDADRLRQLIHILFDNAIRYSAGLPRLELRLLPSPGGWTFMIADDGIGIPASEIGHVFERFRRGGAAAGQHADGAGLGLPMAKAIVDAHHGSIRIDSAENRGTTVSVFLPDAARSRAAA